MVFVPIECRCKNCSNFSACAEYSKYLIENKHESNTPQNLTCCGAAANVLSDMPFDPVDSGDTVLKSLIGYFTKRYKKYTKREKHNDSVVNSEKFNDQREDKNEE